jgi:hypothetical protein
MNRRWTTRAAINTCSATAVQYSNSTGEQIRRCRQFADHHGLIVEDKHIKSDSGVLGSTVAGRHGLDRLLSRQANPSGPVTAIILPGSSRESSQTGAHACEWYVSSRKRTDNLEPNQVRPNPQKRKGRSGQRRTELVHALQLRIVSDERWAKAHGQGGRALKNRRKAP